jgi:predicted DNA binding CopG/RHH family protein
MSKTTEDEVFEYYQNGLPEDFKIDKSKVVRKPIDTSNTTVQISIKFEQSLLKRIRKEAENKSIPYQTFIKEILKEYLDDNHFYNEMENIKQRLSLLESKVT